MDNPNVAVGTLRSLVLQARHSLDTLPAHQTARSRELLDDAIALADDLLTLKPAAVMGAKGGKATAKRMTKKDPDYYKRIAGLRKKRSGGRPKKG